MSRTIPEFRLLEGDRETTVGAITAEVTETAKAAEAAEAIEVARQVGRVVVPPGGGIRPLLDGWGIAERAGVGLWLLRPGLELPPPESVPTPGFTLWLATSGTTGTPKWYGHSRQRLLARLRLTSPQARWLLTYEPASFAGIQVISTAWLSAATLVAMPGADAATLARRAVATAVTHISGTPSFWRTLLLTIAPATLPLETITLGGEIADASLLARLAEAWPQARLRHIYASTEAGAVFAVSDGRAGFPVSWLESEVDGVSLRIREGMLEVRSARQALRQASALITAEETHAGEARNWLKTGDRVECCGDRVLFAGRADGVINIGGVKVLPERVERCLLAVPGVADARVWAEPSPLTGFVLLAEIVPATGHREGAWGSQAAKIEAEAEAALRAAIRIGLAELEAAARPRSLRLVPEITAVVSGKKQRRGPGCGT